MVGGDLVTFPDPYDRRDPKHPDYVADLEDRADAAREAGQ